MSDIDTEDQLLDSLKHILYIICWLKGKNKEDQKNEGFPVWESYSLMVTHMLVLVWYKTILYINKDVLDLIILVWEAV